MMYLASRHEDGRGVAKDPVVSATLFRRAAGLGSAQAMCYLGDLYLWGVGVQKSDADAYRWYTAALLATPQLASDSSGELRHADQGHPKEM
jgi:TPR repeat protein